MDRVLLIRIQTELRNEGIKKDKRRGGGELKGGTEQERDGSRRVTAISARRLKSELFFAPEPKNEKAKALKLPVLQILEDVLGIFQSRDSKSEKITSQSVSA